jgi:hypothetical protein
MLPFNCPPCDGSYYPWCMGLPHDIIDHNQYNQRHNETVKSSEMLTLLLTNNEGINY